MIQLPKLPWKIFWISTIFVFAFGTLHRFGVSLPIQSLLLLSPLPAKADTFAPIRQKLDQKENTYTLHVHTPLFPQSYAATDAEKASSYVVVDYDTGNVLFEKDKSKKLHIASLTKIMTAVVALDISDPQDIFTVTQKATTIEPTIINVKVGEQFSLHELLHALLLTSANDTAEVIKDTIDVRYGEGTFVKAMNEKAALIGLHDSHFTNPQGLDIADNYSSAQDIAILSHYALTNYPEIANIVALDASVLPQTNTHPEFDLPNWNGLLGVYPGIEGVKIGNTSLAGKTAVMLANRENKRILVTLLGAPDITQRDLWTAQLLDQAFAQEKNLPPVHVTEAMLLNKYHTSQYWK